MLTELKKLTCICCGGELAEKDGKLVCKYCKSTFEEVEKISEEEVIALNRATTDRNLLRFDEALEEYNLLLKKYPDNEMANWGAFLCDYGIIYEQDYDGKYIPTCHRLSERPVKRSPYYAKLSLEHQTSANEIEKLRVSIHEKAQKIQPYDVFICYKATEEKRGVSVPTREASWARDIYEILTQKGLRVFFAEKSLAGSNVDYEPHIYSALRSAKMMFVLTASLEHVNATWVANEWKRYAKYVRDGEEKTLRVVYDFINPYDLPKALQNKQAIDHNDMGWVEAVKKAADDIFQIKEETPEWQKAMEEMRVKMNATAGNGAVIADKFCSKCFAPNVKSAKFCGECGNKEFIVAPDGVKYCMDCGTANQIQQKFCLSCGNNKFVYTKEDYQKEVERREQARLAEEERARKEAEKRIVRALAEAERRKRERIDAEERARKEAERRERARLAMEERARKEAERRERERIAAEEKAKKKKAFLKIFIPIMAAILAIIIAITAIDCGARNGLTMQLSADKAYYIVTDCPEDKTEIIIPDTYNGKPVKDISDNAFRDCSGLQSITIPDSVTDIGAYAFRNCNSLTSITIPDSVTNIGDSAFYDCGSLTNVKCPANVCHYLSRNIKTVVITSGKSIGDSAFEYCSSLMSITIPDSVTDIGNGAFEGCGSLTSITIPDSVTNIGDWAFYYCDSLTSITISDSVTSIGDGAFNGCSSLTSITIPDSVTSIGAFAFEHCSSLMSITIPDSVTSIGDWAFYYCDSLTSITIPDSVTSIGDGAFYNCSSLTSIKFNGTKAQWENMQKGTSWDEYVPATEVECSDGKVSI